MCLQLEPEQATKQNLEQLFKMNKRYGQQTRLSPFCVASNKMKTLHNTILNLSLENLRQWAGSKIFNRGKSYLKNVYDITRTRDGGLLASVSGTDDYKTWVGVDADEALDYFCSCPYDWGVCKHAVALVLVGLNKVKTDKEIPLADDDSLDFMADPDDEYDDNYDEDAILPEEAKNRLEQILQKKTKKELVDLLMNFSLQLPEISRDILEDEQLQRGDITKLLAALRLEIEEITSEDAWYNPWKDEGHLPDYSHLHQQLTALLAKGYVDEVVALGRQLWEEGSKQVGYSHDEGETAEEVADCMSIVFEAVPISSLSSSQQLLWLIDIFLEDDYSLSDEGEPYIHAESYTKDNWLEVVQELQFRLAKTAVPKGDDFSSRYHREQLMDWLITALEKSGRPDEVLALLEKEVHRVQCYGRLVDHLLAEGKTRQAREWCIKGVEQTKNSAIGIAANLQKKLREMAKHDKNPQMVAAYRAQDFFYSSGLENYLALQKATEKIDCWSEIRSAALHYLETGQRPDQEGKKKDWILPDPEVASERDKRFRPHFPQVGILIDIAIHEKRLDDVVALHQARQKQSGMHGSKEREVAEAVAVSHPDVALLIWHKLALEQIAQVTPSAYYVAATYLGKMGQVYQQRKQLTKWQSIITSIRTKHKRKRRLLEVLDSLEGKRLID